MCVRDTNEYIMAEFKCQPSELADLDLLDFSDMYCDVLECTVGLYKLLLDRPKNDNNDVNLITFIADTSTYFCIVMWLNSTFDLQGSSTFFPVFYTFIISSCFFLISSLNSNIAINCG